jgi:hypothetical protein
MEKESQDAPDIGERRLSYCEFNTKERDNLRLGAGSPDEILSLPDDGANIRYFLLEPLDACPWRARWGTGNLDEDTGKITDHPWAHPSQAEGAWARFFLPLIQRQPKIMQRILSQRIHDGLSAEVPVWIRVLEPSLSVSRLAAAPTLESLLRDASESERPSIYIRLLGEPIELVGLMGALVSESSQPDH